MRLSFRYLFILAVIFSLCFDTFFFQAVMGTTGDNMTGELQDNPISAPMILHAPEPASEQPSDRKPYPFKGFKDYRKEIATVSYQSAREFAKLNGTWMCAENSLGHTFYTGYLKLNIQDGVLKMVDWQAGNPGFIAKVTGIDDQYIYFKIIESDEYPADWQLQTRDRIQYEVRSKDELLLTYGDSTCVFTRKN